MTRLIGDKVELLRGASRFYWDEKAPMPPVLPSLYRSPKRPNLRPSTDERTQHAENSQRTAPTPERGRNYKKRYIVSKARGVSPRFRDAFPRIGRSNEFTVADKKDPIWDDWTDLKPELGKITSDDHGHRFQPKPPAPPSGDQSSSSG